MVVHNEVASDGLPVSKVVKSAKRVGKSVEAQQQDKSSDDVIDITEKCKEEDLKMASTSGALPIFKEKRKPKLADTQKSPYIPSSTVKRIIPGVATSEHDYDPMLPVAEDKWQRFEEWRQHLKDDKTLDASRRAEFFAELLLPRHEWDYSKNKTGWLRDSHLSSALAMFRLRDRRDNSPFRPRVGFIEQWFMHIMQVDFNSLPSKKSSKIMFNEEYLSHFNGCIPPDSASGKRWWHDIDNLYGIVNVQRNHWVAVDINFPQEKIFVYDSIPGHTTDQKLLELLMFLRRMMPEILNIMVPHNERKPNHKMFKLTRVKKNVPVNENPGDCGLFSIKYIECLALGWNFDGLNDRNVMTLRRRLAAELFDEVADIISC